MFAGINDSMPAGLLGLVLEAAMSWGAGLA